MTEKSPLEIFIERVSRVPIPDSQVERAKLYARELAMGVNERLWDFYDVRSTGPYQVYIEKRWALPFYPPDPSLVRELGYFRDRSTLTRQAFDLLSEVEGAQTFISYKRDYSSTFALLILERLKQVSIPAFLDMSITGGEDWQRRIQQEIVGCKYFILLIAPGTLDSEHVAQEIGWAVENRRVIVPVCHAGFTIDRVREMALDPSIKEALLASNAITVVRESALEYHTRIVELLNVFGLTP